MSTVMPATLTVKQVSFFGVLGGEQSKPAASIVQADFSVRLGWGITDGSKWAVYAYSNKSEAENFLAAVVSDGSPMSLRLNICVSEPLRLIGA